MWFIYFLACIVVLFWAIGVTNHIINEKDKTEELEGLKIQIQHLQDTLDHYGIRMSNKMPDENKYYKRWFK